MSGGACKIILCGEPRRATLGMAESLAAECLAGRIKVSEDVFEQINKAADIADAKIKALCMPFVPT